MGFSGNFTAVTLGDDPEVAGKKALFIQGQTEMRPTRRRRSTS